MKATVAVLVFAMAWPTVAALCYFVGLAGTDPAAGAANLWFRSFYYGSKAIQFALPVLWLGLWQRQPLKPATPHFAGLRFGLAFGVLVAGAMLALYFGLLRDSALLQAMPGKLRAKLADFGADTPIKFILLGAFLTIVHSLLEEYYWRWFIFGELKRLIRLWPAIVVSGLAFMAHHVVVLNMYVANIPFMLALSLSVAVGGMVWAWLYHRTGSIWSAWVSHLIIDAAIMTLGYDLAFGGRASLP